MIFVSKHIVPKGFVGITLFPFIFLKRKDLKHNYELVNHEKIHLQQQKELLIVFFYLFYFFEWAVKFLKYRNSFKAYKNLSFEREAYLNEENLYYLEKRKTWTFLNYL
ncbi:hypothetical protein CXF68_00135 [Tenacibaculum sp. Bg11-29]|nr:hypothetical protein [Tenacibaculum sp. Bg11-29]PKH49188.1 hypothetical protein CXF68_00135 [Tenacibaculum sp. Bg11-29]